MPPDIGRDLYLGPFADPYGLDVQRPKHPRYALFRNLDGSIEIETQSHVAKWWGRGPITYTPPDPPDEIRALVKFVRDNT
jgi:hypothetical protein